MLGGSPKFPKACREMSPLSLLPQPTHVQAVQKMWFPELLGLGSSTWEVVWGEQHEGKGAGVPEESVHAAIAQTLRPGHQGPVFSSNTLISL